VHSEVFSLYIFYRVCKFSSCFSFSAFGVYLLKTYRVFFRSQNFEPEIVGPKVCTHFATRHLLFCFSFSSGVDKPRTPICLERWLDRISQLCNHCCILVSHLSNPRDPKCWVPWPSCVSRIRRFWVCFVFCI